MDERPLQARLLALPGIEHAEVIDVVDSTNARLAALGRTDGCVGAVVVARRQTAGRGRRGRTWLDVPDGNVAMSLGVAMPVAAPGLLPLAAALALRDVFTEAGASTSLKWPNDVRLVADGRPRKAAGILVEGHPGLATPAAVIGVGINVDWRHHHPEDPAAATWTALADVLDRDVDRADLVVALVSALQAWHDVLVADPARVRKAYRGACDTLGVRVAVDLGSPAAVEGPSPARLVGTAHDLDAQGRLVVATADGPVTVAAGDVVHLRER